MTVHAGWGWLTTAALMAASVVALVGGGTVAGDVGRPDSAPHAGDLDSGSARGGQTISLTGTVTFRHDQPDRERITLVVQDDDRAVWVVAPYRRTLDRAAGFQDFGPQVGPGHRVTVEGTVDATSFSRAILATSVVPSGAGPLPPPMSEEQSGVFRGACGPVRTVLEGIVQSIRSDKGVKTLSLDVDGRRVTIRSARGTDDEASETFVDARVRVTGVAGSLRNARGQFLGPVLVINGFHDIDRVVAPPSSAFESPFVPLADVARFGTPTLNGHRFQTEGVVTRGVPMKYIHLQEGGVGIRVETGDREAYKPGDRVRVAGFLDTGRQLRGIMGAVTKRVSNGSPPEAARVTPDIIASAVRQKGAAARSPDYAGRLVTVEATVADAGPTRDGGVLRLASGDTILEAVLRPEAYELAAALSPGSEISVTGIVQYEVARQHEEVVDGRLYPFERFSLLVHEPSDIVLVRAPSWWTPVRLSAALAAVLAVLLAALAWAWFLRRQVRLQAAAIAKEMRARREAAVEFQATLRERTRLAANLHDTLLQSMAGIGFQLEACQMSARRVGESAQQDAAEALDVARRMVDHAVDDIRGSVWALRSTAVDGQSLTEAVEALITRVGAGHQTRIEFRTEGEPFPLPNFVTGNLLLIVQEAVFNALRHGFADSIEIVAAFHTEDATVNLSIHDDGAGFSLGDQRGPEDGHFGLQGMRERAERLGGRLFIDSRTGDGTIVRCRIRCRDYDPEIERDGEAQPAAPAAAAGGQWS